MNISKIKHILSFFILIIGHPAYSQLNHDYYSFINIEQNKLIYDEESSIIPFFEKLDSVTKNRNGNINIIHFGGSHVQAGVLPNQIRINLLNAFPDNISSRGMIFPFSAAKKCNNPEDYKVAKNGEFNLVRNVYDSLEKPLGVTGIAVYTNDNSSHIAINLEDELKYKTNKIKLFAFAEGAKIVPTVKIDKKEYLPTTHDTIKRIYTFIVEDFYDSFVINIPNENSGTFVITGILLENDDPGITFHSIGVNGAKAESFLKCEFLSLDLESINPDLVIFGLGINDSFDKDFSKSKFIEDYQMLIDKIKEVCPNCTFIFITNNDSYFRVSKNFYKVNTRSIAAREAFFELAKQNKGAVWDQFEIMGGLGSMEIWEKEKLAKPDKIHFTNKGYEIIGNLFFEAFIGELRVKFKNRH